MALSLAVTAGAATLSDYSDSDKVTAKYATAVDFATQTGILEGMGNGTYAPQGTLTRAQLATMVYRMTTGDVADVYTANFAGGAAENFSDTAATAWYAGYVGYAADAELLKGLGDGTYAPDAALTGYAALAAFLRGVGYDEPGHNFVGADWTIEVAKVAKQAGALEGISNVDLNKPITREVAAQMIYNIMFADLVEYTPAFGYQTLFVNNDDLATREFEIVTAKDGANDNIAPWGRPVTEWNDKDGDAVVSIAFAPVAEYTTAATECEIGTDLGLKEDGVVSKLYVNGASVSRATEFNSDREITLKDTSTKVGAQGTLTEVYLVDDEYQVVEIETWLGKVTDVIKATYDKAGHEKTPAKTDVTVYGGVNAVDVDTAEFAEDSYVLVNKTEWVDEDYNGDYFLTATAPAATGEITAYSNANKTTTIGGNVYDWAAMFNLGYDKRTDIEGVYDVFEDFYGNVIGLIETETVYSYGIITKMAWNPSQTILEDAKAFANILDFGATPDTSVWMSGIFMQEELVEFGVASGTSPAKDSAKVSMTAAYNFNYYDVATQFETQTDGSVAIVAYGAEDTVTIEKGKTTNIGGYFTNDNTVYLVKTDDDTYVSYTGFRTVPSMENVPVTYFGEDNYVTYVFVNATDAVFTGDTFNAYIADEEIDGKIGDLYEYEMYVDGKAVTKMSKAADLGTGFAGTGLYEVTVDAEGYILSVKDLDANGFIMTFSSVAHCDGTVITDGSKAISHEKAPVYVIDAAEKTVDTDCTYADAVEETCFVVLDEAGGDVAVAIYIYK